MLGYCKRLPGDPRHHTTRRHDRLGTLCPRMPAKKKARRRQMPHSRRIDVARIVSVGQNRDTGEAVIRLRDGDRKLIALCLPPRQFGTLARGVLG